MSQLTYLNEREHDTLRAINDVLYPPGGTIPYSANEVGVREYVDDYVYRLGGRQRLLIRALLLLLEIGPVIFLRARRRLSRLDVHERIAFLEWLDGSSFYVLRIVLISIRTIVGMAFMADERVLAAMGYFKDCPYPGDPRKLPTSRDVPGARDQMPEEVRHAD